MTGHRPQPATGPTAGPAAGTNTPDTPKPIGRMTRLADRRQPLTGGRRGSRTESRPERAARAAGASPVIPSLAPPRLTSSHTRQGDNSMRLSANSTAECSQPGPAEPARVIPFPRKPPDNAIPTTKPDPGTAESTYNRPDERRPGWLFTGQVEYVGGSEGDRMRAQLADVIRELLEWAAGQSRDQDREAA
jgi:hypothetical protein